MCAACGDSDKSGNSKSARHMPPSDTIHNLLHHYRLQAPCGMLRAAQRIPLFWIQGHRQSRYKQCLDHVYCHIERQKAIAQVVDLMMQCHEQPCII